MKNHMFWNTSDLENLALAPTAAQFSYFHPISTELQKSTKNCLKSCLRATKIRLKIQAYFENPLAEFQGGRGDPPSSQDGPAGTSQEPKSKTKSLSKGISWPPELTFQSSKPCVFSFCPRNELEAYNIKGGVSRSCPPVFNMDVSTI